ncbi:MAG: replication restart helicase PriA, partial [Salinispira sp.]
KKRLTAYVVGESESRPDLPPHVQCRPIEKFIDQEAVFTHDLLDLAGWISRSYMCSLGESLSAMIPGGRQNRDFIITDDETITDSPRPNTEQMAAVASICASTRGNFYLYGVTGSGKTEVFLRTAGKTIHEGRGVIYLVPEISLSHQIVDVISDRFGKQVAVLHSGLSAGQRIDQWRKILKGEALIVVGARSAVFAPLKSIGLIVIDEEHEGTYKSSSHPRYHARQVAMYRAGKHGARLVMGSATPSVESWYHCKRGTFTYLRLTERVAEGSLPRLNIVSLRNSSGSLSDRLKEEMRRVLGKGRQVLLFLNRRGFGYFYHCRSCGADFGCSRCSVSLTYHKTRNQLLCHHCGYYIPAPSVCPQCGSRDLGFSGFGTEKVEEDVRNNFPSFRTLRLDTDTTRKRGALEKGIRDFRQGDVDILLGTQMIAKGLNFPGIGLVGIILADSSLHIPDFRSFEKTFSLITQVAGRAGRFGSGGKVILQTLNPDHHIIRLAASHDSEGFYARELYQRQNLSFPPFSRMLRILMRGRSIERVWDAARKFEKELRQLFSGQADGEMLGPVECPVSVLNKNHRVHILLIVKGLSRLQAALPEIVKKIRLPAGVYVEIDVDPQSML